MGGSEKRKSSGKKAGKPEPTVHANLASKNSSSLQATESSVKVSSSDLIADNLHDHLKQGNEKIICIKKGLLFSSRYTPVATDLDLL